jgi:hypothetical protein
LEKLRKHNQKLTEQLRLATETNSVRARGKNVGRKRLKTLMGRNDEDNHRNVSAYLRKILFPWAKMLPPNWIVYGVEKRNSVCGRVMPRVQVPEGQSDRAYWENFVCIWINDRMVMMRSNFKEQCRKQYLSKCLGRAICKIYYLVLQH